MFEYKNASFYTSFFNNLPDFNVLEEFKESEDKEEKNLYVGKVEVLNTIHPLELRVEIPFSFPHMHLTFRTKSIHGYPHLIHTGKIKYGDWFCLNTPFAETAEEQLNQEVSRLREWIKRQLREDLPAIIEDPNVITGLRLANAYDWENLDEMNEFSADANLTFIGDCHLDPNNFPEQKGYFHCIKTTDNRYFAMKEKTFTNYELPYIIVDEMPNPIESIHDFVALRNYYGWDDSICNHLFPDSNINLNKLSCSESYDFSNKHRYNEEESLRIIAKHKEELAKEDSYLPGNVRIGTAAPSKDYNLIKVLPSYKPLLLEKLNLLEEKVRKEHYFSPHEEAIRAVADTIGDDDPYKEYLIDHWIEIGQYMLNFFVLGIRKEEVIEWLVLGTNHTARKEEIITFNMELKKFSIKRLLSYPLWSSLPQSVTKTMYFGRGAFSEPLVEKKIAVVGLGAIGSILVESLARSGVHNLGLWDSDIIEPGNICRSIYDTRDLGESKVRALEKKIQAINPLCDVKSIKSHGGWEEYSAFNIKYENGSFYGDINYNNQDEAIAQIKDYDLIIDCTGSNELLHFLSYAVPGKDIVSLCITNHANQLLCVTSRDGNPFELRKAYLSRIEQDTKNFYLEGSGCYSPTFLARNSDIASLVNLAARELNLNMEKGELMHSTIWSHDRRGVLADRLETFALDGYNIRMSICSETIYDGEDLSDAIDGQIGYLLGSYSKDGQMIMVTHIVDALNAEEKLTDAFKTSEGIIDYIGDFTYSDAETGTYKQQSLDLIARKAKDKDINTCNPMLAMKNTDGTLSFFLYINGCLVPFKKED